MIARLSLTSRRLVIGSPDGQTEGRSESRRLSRSTPLQMTGTLPILTPIFAASSVLTRGFAAHSRSKSMHTHQFRLDPSVVAAFAFVLYIVALYGWTIWQEWRIARKARLGHDTTTTRDTCSDSGSHPSLD